MRGVRETTLFSLKHTRINVLVGTWKLFGLLICHCYCFVLKRRALKPDVIYLIINIRTINTPNTDTYKVMHSIRNYGCLSIVTFRSESVTFKLKNLLTLLDIYFNKSEVNVCIRVIPSRN